MTVYLIDENVLRELHSKGDREVRTWYASVAQTDLRISAMTFFEKRLGMGTQAEAMIGLGYCRHVGFNRSTTGVDHP